MTNCERPVADAGRPLKWSVWNDVIPIGDSHAVIFNTLCRNAVIVSREEMKKVPEDEAWQRLGFTVDADVDEEAAWDESFMEATADMSYIDLTILLTHQCQMRCQYCFEGEKENTNIGADTGQSVLRYLENHKEECRRVRVTWFGGEPLLNFGALRDMSRQLIEFCSENVIEYSADITTNAFALTPARCKELVDDLKVGRFIITLDGPPAIHDRRRPLRSGLPTFARIWQNIGDLLAAGAGVTIRMTIDRENAPYFPAFLEYIARSAYAGRVGLSFCRTIDYNFTPGEVKPLLYSEQEFAEVEWQLILKAHELKLYRYRFPHAAPAGGCLRRGDVVVGSDGIVYKCLDTVGDRRWAVATVDEIDLAEKMPEWYKRWSRWTPAQSAECSRCVLRPLCSGGCPHNSLFQDKKHGSGLPCPDWKPNYRKQIIELVKEYDKTL